MTDALAGSYVAEIEQEVLGALLHGGDYRKVSGFLRPQHFIADLHRIIFEAIGEAFERYGSTSVPIVSRLLPESSGPAFMARAGETAISYMTGLRDVLVAGPGGVDRSGRAVVAQWARLKAGELGGQLTALASDPGADPAAMVRGLANDLDNITAELRAGHRRRSLYSMDEATEDALAEIREAMKRGHGLTGVTWGLTDINVATGGIQAGEMVVIGARPGMGKTAIASSVALRAAGSGVGVGLISLEMGVKRLAMRALTDIAYDWNIKVPYTDLIKGKVSESDLNAIVQAKNDLDNLPLWIEEQAGLTITDIRVKIERIKERSEARGVPFRVLIIDYLQIVRPSGRYAGNRNGEITEISWSLREFAREYGIGIIALSQLSRGVEGRDDKRPTLSDLRDSGAIEQDADMVAFLYREAYYLDKAKGKDSDKETERLQRLIEVQNTLEFVIAKQRNGPTKTIPLFVDIACSAVRNGARHQ